MQKTHPPYDPTLNPYALPPPYLPPYAGYASHVSPPRRGVSSALVMLLLLAIAGGTGYVRYRHYGAPDAVVQVEHVDTLEGKWSRVGALEVWEFGTDLRVFYLGSEYPYERHYDYYLDGDMLTVRGLGVYPVLSYTDEDLTLHIDGAPVDFLRINNVAGPIEEETTRGTDTHPDATRGGAKAGR